MSLEFIKGQEIEGKIKDGVKIVNFYASWCGPCKMFSSVLEDISTKYEVFKINIDEENSDFLQSEKVQSVPTTKIYKDGVLISVFEGFLPKEKILEKI